MFIFQFVFLRQDSYTRRASLSLPFPFHRPIDTEIGNSPDKRGQKLMKSKGIPMSHVARQIKPEDYRRFDFIFGMDEDNLSNLRRRKPTDAQCEIDFLGSFDPQGEKIIHDPYTGTMDDFVHVYEQCLRCCDAFLQQQT